MTGRPSPKISKKKMQILETAEDLLTRYGMKRVTVEEICRKAGVSKMTFYKYFENKTELVKQLWHGWVEDNFKKVDEINAMDISFPEKLDLILEMKMGMASKFNPEFMVELLSLDLDLEEPTQRIMEFILEAQKKGEIRPEIRPEFILAAFDKLNELARDENLRKIYPDFSELSREGFNFFYYGLLARPE